MIFQINQLPSLWRRSKIDFLIWIVTFTSVVLFDVSCGLIIGVAFAMMTVLFRSQWPDSICLGNVPGTEIYKGVNAYRNDGIVGPVVELPGIKIYRFESPLYFANAALFKEQLYHKTKCDPIEMKSRRLNAKLRLETDSLQRPMISKSNIDELDGTHEGRVINGVDLSSDTKDEIDSLFAVIIDCSSFPYMDLSGVETLRQVYEEYSKIGVRVIFCSVKGKNEIRNRILCDS
uniref:STAS domain-containing protein n=1 Tax=Romanomermis culicivorax TaxID=13658 RepID=A0A915KPS7_ROMCU